jgi:1-deoxy-D-xylulose-5-phosphate reductoisomerase
MSSRNKKRVALLGATGSIGGSARNVIARGADDFEIVLLSAHTDSAGLEQAGRDWPDAVRVLSGGPGGRERLLAAIAGVRADITVNGISGAAGLEPSMAALESGSRLALANKETLVMAGPLVFKRAAEKNAAIIPVDSEHSAVFHLIESRKMSHNTEEIILTASGGPFRNYSPEQLKTVTPQDALAHPTWNMGPKITVDSASLANKGLEVIEAARLFNMPPERIKVVIHPQSVVHSMIRTYDGAVYAQLSPPDMRLPIHQALYWPQSGRADFGRLDFDALTLTFSLPDMRRFPMLDLAYRSLAGGGLYPCAYNGANEAAVAAFLAGRIGFPAIADVTRHVLDTDWSGEAPDIASVLEADKTARELAERFIQQGKT